MDEFFYSILDLNISLKSDSPDLMKRFDEDYAWFRSPVLGKGKGLYFTVRLVEKKRAAFQFYMSILSNDLDPPTYTEQIYSLKDRPQPLVWSLQKIVGTILLEIEEYLVFHAATLEQNGLVTILVGPPGVGKTTLALKLLERGFRFMSDDSCPINRSTGKVHPFHRRAWVVKAKSINEGFHSYKKEPVSLTGLGAKIFNKPCYPGYVFCMGPNNSHNSEHEVQMVLKKGMETPLLDELKLLQGVQLDTKINSSAQIAARIRYPRAGGLSEKVRSLLHIHESAIWTAYRWDRVWPNFNQTPKLYPLSTDKGAFTMLQHMKAAKLELSSGSGISMFWECAQFLRNASVWQLQTGNLKETVDQILNVMNGGSMAHAPGKQEVMA